MIRVLQVVTNMDRGGLESMLMNYYRHIDREKIQFDFLVHRQERVVVSSVSNSRSLAGMPAPVRALSRVDLPAFV